MKIRRSVRIVVVPGLRSPAVMGVFHPQILLPHDVAQTFTDVELRHIVLHELAHVQRFDLALNGLLSALQIAHWWNPTFWIVRNRLLAERELACDARVLAVIGGSESTQYGRTLIRVVERLATTLGGGKAWDLPNLSPGMLHLLGRSRALKNRLRQLPRGARQSNRSKVVAAWLVIVTLAATGLTDAKQPRPDEPNKHSFEFPANARFQVFPVGTAMTEEPAIERSFDVGDLIDKIGDEERLKPDIARTAFKNLVEIHAKRFHRSPATNPTSSFCCDYSDKSLVCRGSSRAVDYIDHMLAVWRQYGFGQIVFEVRFIDSSFDLVDQLGLSGGEICFGSRRNEFEAGLSNSATGNNSLTASPSPQGTSETTVSCPMPLYIKVLDAETMRRTAEFTQQNTDVNTLFAPKITTFQGQVATIVDQVSRPFVVGIRTNQNRPASVDASSKDSRITLANSTTQINSQYTPEIATLTSGWSLQVAGVSQPDQPAVQIDYELVRSEITDVYTGAVGQGPDSPQLTVQLPSLQRSVCRAAASVKSGETLLIHSLKRSTEKRRSYVLITPTKLTDIAPQAE
jgi:hypothetical protein